MISAVLGVAGLAGVAITKTAIASVINNWAGIIGGLSFGAGALFNGNITFKQYRTSQPVPTGYGKTLYKFRYQDIRIVATVKNKKIDRQLKVWVNGFLIRNHTKHRG